MGGTFMVDADSKDVPILRTAKTAIQNCVEVDPEGKFRSCCSLSFFIPSHGKQRTFQSPDRLCQLGKLACTRAACCAALLAA